MRRTRTRTRSAAVWFAVVLFALLFAHASVLYVLLFDEHHAIIHVFSLQVIRSRKRIMLLQICCMELHCVAAVVVVVCLLFISH